MRNIAIAFLAGTVLGVWLGVVGMSLVLERRLNTMLQEQQQKRQAPQNERVLEEQCVPPAFVHPLSGDKACGIQI